jgi:Tfp pilus assembly protein PilF
MALATELMRKESRILDDAEVHIPILVADDVWTKLVSELQQRFNQLWGTSGTAETGAHMDKTMRRLRERCFRITQSSYLDWKTMAERRLVDVEVWPTMALALAAHAHSGNAAIMVAHNALIKGDLAILSCGVPAWSSFALHRELDEAPPGWYHEYIGGTPSEPPAPELDTSTLIGALQAPSEQAPQAARNLGVLLAEQGDVEGARAAFQQAIASGHPDEAPRAARNLGLLLAEQGDLEGARAALQQAIASGHPDEGPRAARNLGLLRAEQGDLEGARAALQQAIASGHRDHAPLAARSLGMLLRRSDVQGACAAFQQAIASGHPNQAPRAAVNLGITLAKQRDVEGARAAFRQAIDSQHADSAPQAARNLGLLLAEQGDVEGARAAFERAIESGHPDQASRAAVNLGALLAKAHDLVGARAAFQRAITTADEIRDPEVRELARAALALPTESTERVEPDDSP